MAGINQIKVGHVGPELEMLMSVNDVGEVFLFDTNDVSRSPLYLDNYGESTWGCDMHRSGLVAVSDNSHAIKVFDLHTGASPKILKGHRHNIPSVSFTSDGSHLLSASIDGSAIIWEVATGQSTGYLGQYTREWLWRGLIIDTRDIQPVTEQEWGATPSPVVDWSERRANDTADTSSIKTSSSFGSAETSDEESSVHTAAVQETDSASDESASDFSPEEFGPLVLETASSATHPSFLALISSMSILQLVSPDAPDLPLSCLPCFRQRDSDMARLSLLEWLPELSLAIVASQSGGYISLY
ncbi:hypothetical protein HDU91_000114 [Kappamyces sp. JEL0680]|nr:hypothetical protein HDU91_000114 [Kappamyces sp. JEL0680]